jgi:hypothetical protein
LASSRRIYCLSSYGINSVSGISTASALLCDTAYLVVAGAADDAACGSTLRPEHFAVQAVALKVSNRLSAGLNCLFAKDIHRFQRGGEVDLVQMPTAVEGCRCACYRRLGEQSGDRLCRARRGCFYRWGRCSLGFSRRFYLIVCY